jgi:membrane glycosyltransferase
MAVVLAAFAPDALPWALPTLLSCLFAIPFAVVTAYPGLGHFMQRNGICAVPEDTGD